MYAAIRQGKAKTGMAEETGSQDQSRCYSDHQRCRRPHGLLCGLRAGRHRDSNQHFQQSRGRGGVEPTRARVD